MKKKPKIDMDLVQDLYIHDWLVNEDVTANLKYLLLNGCKKLGEMSDEELIQKVQDMYEHEFEADETFEEFLQRKKGTIPSYLD